MRNVMQVLLFSLVISAISCKEKTQKAVGKEEVKSEVTLPAINKADVEKTVLAFNDAMVNVQKEVLESLCADELSYGHSSGLIQNKDEFIDDLINGPFDFSSLIGEYQTINLSDNTAVVRHIFVAEGTRDGNPANVRIGNMQVYQQQEDGTWKLLARQAYKL